MDDNLLREKLNQLVLDALVKGNREIISFITALLNAKGYTYIRSDIGEALNDYARLNGKDVYFDVQDKLLKDGIIAIKTDEYNKALQLNLDKDREGIEEFALKFAEEFVDKAEGYFSKILDEIRDMQDGDYVLKELAKVVNKDNFVGDESIYHIRKAIGDINSNIIYDKLYRRGILIIAGFSKKHTYYHFLYALKKVIFFRGG